MKLNRKNLLLLAASSLASFALTAPAFAAALTWSGGDGDWQTDVQGGWNGVWAANDTGTFNGSGGTVSVKSESTTGNAALAFTAGDYTLQSDGATERIITLGNTSITLGNGVTNTIGSKVTLTRANVVTCDGGSTATSTLNINSDGKLATTGSTSAITIKETTTNVNTGGIIDTDASIVVGNTADGATLNVLGGTVIAGKINNDATISLGNALVVSTVNLKITGGSLGFATAGNQHGIRIGNSTGSSTITGIIDLEGGIVTVRRIFESSAPQNSTLNLHGGTIKALANNVDFINVDYIWIKSGGAIFDSNGKTITVAKDMLTDVSSLGGGLTLNDTAVTKGTLTLSGALTYIGPTIVTAGKLVVPSTHAGTGALTVSANATLEVTVSGTSQWLPDSLTLADPCTLEFSSVQNPGTTTAPIQPTNAVGAVAGVTINIKSISGGEVAGNSYPLLGQVSATTGYTLGTQPVGVTGHLAISGGSTLVYVVDWLSDIWTGADGTNPTWWDVTTTVNWAGNALLNTPARSYANGDPVLFDDTATPVSPVAVAIQTAVAPGTMAFANSTKNYIVTSSGAFGIGGSGSLTKSGSGTLTLSGTNGYSGGTSLSGGILTATNTDALGTGAVAINPGATRLVVNDGVTLANNITINGGGATDRGLIENSSTGNATLSGGTITINAATAAGGHFASTGGGTLTVASLITATTPIVLQRTGKVIYSGGGTGYTNLTSGGTILVGANDGIATSATVGLGVSATPGILDLNGFNQNLVGITKGANSGTIGNSSTTSDSTLTTTGTSTYGGVIVDAVGSGTRKVNLTVNGGALTLTGANTYGGNTTVNAGTLTCGNAPSPLNANTGNDASTVTIAATGATLNLTYTGTDKVAKLVIGTTPQAAGVYGKDGSAPPIIGIPQITGDGTLAVGAGFSSWVTGTFTGGATVPADKQGPNDDPDSDGIPNLVEYAVAGQDPMVANPTIGTFTANTLSFTKRGDATGHTYAIQDSTDLGIADAWAEVPGGSYVNSATTISYTLTPGTPPRNFIRLKVTQIP